MTLDEKIAMLKQMRWIAAQKATGGRRDKATAEMIQFHQTLLAMEAARDDGAPQVVWNVDIDGHPLTLEHAWNQQRAADEANAAQSAYDRLDELNRDTD